MAVNDVKDAYMQERGMNTEFGDSRALPAQTAGAGDATTTVYIDPRTAEPNVNANDFTTEVLSGKVVFDGAYAGGGTNYGTISLVARNPDGTTAATLVTHNFTAAVAAGTPVDLGIPVGAGGTIPAGGSLAVVQHQVAAGAAFPAGSITIGYAWPTKF